MEEASGGRAEEATGGGRSACLLGRPATKCGQLWRNFFPHCCCDSTLEKLGIGPSGVMLVGIGWMGRKENKESNDLMFYLYDTWVPLVRVNIFVFSEIKRCMVIKIIFMPPQKINCMGFHSTKIINHGA